jgi:hypothetical protein
MMIESGSRCCDEPLPSWAGHEAEIVEVPLLLPAWQVSALEQAAHQHGVTAAEMVRGLLRDFLSRQPEKEPEPIMARPVVPPVC